MQEVIPFGGSKDVTAKSQVLASDTDSGHCEYSLGLDGRMAAWPAWTWSDVKKNGRVYTGELASCAVPGNSRDATLGLFRLRAFFALHHGRYFKLHFHYYLEAIDLNLRWWTLLAPNIKRRRAGGWRLVRVFPRKWADSNENDPVKTRLIFW